jgi:hypothetical protein
VNDDKKDPNSKLAGTPNASSDADENPWDEDDGGGRTLATDGPSFELPSNIPSPITVPPPPVAIPKLPGGGRPRSPTMMGFGPMGPPLPGAGAGPAAPAKPIAAVAPVAPKAGAVGAPASSRAMPVAALAPAPKAIARPAPRAPGVPLPSAALPLPSARARAEAPAAPAPKRPSVPNIPNLDDDEVPPSGATNLMENAPARRAPAPAPGNASEREDAPTMMGQPLVANAALRDDVVNPRRPQSPLASTGYLPDDGDLPKIGDPVDSEETTRAVSREEMMLHSDAQVVLGDDDEALGDENTLAVAPGQLGDLGIDPALVAALSEGRAHPQSNPEFPPSQPFGPQQPYQSQSGMGAAPPYQGQAPQSQPQQPVGSAPSWQGEAWQGDAAAQSYRNPPQQPMGQMGQMGMQQGYDPLLPQGGYPMQGGQGGQGGPMPMPYPGQQASPNGPMGMGQQMQPMPPQQWMQPMAPASGGGFAKKFTPQIIMLIVVGAVCLSIFIVGIVLFVTTNFQRP